MLSDVCVNMSDTMMFFFCLAKMVTGGTKFIWDNYVWGPIISDSTSCGSFYFKMA